MAAYTARKRHAAPYRALERSLAGTTTCPVGAVANPITALTGVSCSDPRFCFAVGAHPSNNGIAKPLVQRWDGKDWKSPSNPAPSGAGVVR